MFTTIDAYHGKIYVKIFKIVWMLDFCTFRFKRSCGFVVWMHLQIMKYFVLKLTKSEVAIRETVKS